MSECEQFPFNGSFDCGRGSNREGEDHIGLWETNSSNEDLKAALAPKAPMGPRESENLSNVLAQRQANGNGHAGRMAHLHRLHPCKKVLAAKLRELQQEERTICLQLEMRNADDPKSEDIEGLGGDSTICTAVHPQKVILRDHYALAHAQNANASMSKSIEDIWGRAVCKEEIAVFATSVAARLWLWHGYRTGALPGSSCCLSIKSCLYERVHVCI